MAEYDLTYKKIGSDEELTPLSFTFGAESDSLAVEESKKLVDQATYASTHAGFELVELVRVISKETVPVAIE